jgi:hypothetical protein
MGNGQSQKMSFSKPVLEHIQGLFDLVDALKVDDVPAQHVAIDMLENNVDDWIDAINKMVPGGIAGSLLKKSLNVSVQDEIQLAFGILHCKCNMGKFGICPQAELLRSAQTEVQKGHATTVEAMAVLLGQRELWEALWAKQLLYMDRYFTLVSQGSDGHTLSGARQDCYAVGGELSLALDNAMQS